MAENTKIEWARHTWNPVWGCSRVSAGCQNCYAEKTARRFGVKWGDGEARRPASEKIWGDPFKWNSALDGTGRTERVFLGSMMDWADMQIPAATQDRMWKTVKACKNLEWLMLTKRVGNIPTALPADWGEGYPNVRLGCTIENQAMADLRIPLMKKIPKALPFFLSAEPLLEGINLDHHLGLKQGNNWNECLCSSIDPTDRPCLVCDGRKELGSASGIGWIIPGGESGHGARPCAMEWISSLIDQGEKAGVPVFVKQLGAVCVSEDRQVSKEEAKDLGCHPDGWAWVAGHGKDNPKGGDIERWPDEFRVRQFPEFSVSK